MRRSTAMSESAECTYVATINRAAILLLAMSFRPDLESSLIDEIAVAVTARGGRIDDQWFAQFDLRAVSEAIVERTMAILSNLIRERLPGIADEMDDAFGESLRKLVASIVFLFPTV
jgi:hypothetical protein